MIEYFLEEIDGAKNYYNLFLEHKGQEIACDLFSMACDELDHANFWLGLISFTDEYREEYSKLYETTFKTVHEEDGGMMYGKY